jgi:hypothetical protein
MNDDLETASLRAAFAATGETSAAVPQSSACPPPAALWAAVSGELQPWQVRALVDHTAGCAGCAEDWRLAAAQLQETRPGEEAEEAPRPARRGHPWPWLATAAAAAIVATVVGVEQARRAPEGPVYRQGWQPPPIDSRLREGEALPRRRCLLRWSPVAGAVSYDVQVSSEDLNLLGAASGLATPEFQVSAEKLANVPAGGRIDWRVKALRKDGSEQSSQTFVTPLAGRASG